MMESFFFSLIYGEELKEAIKLPMFCCHHKHLENTKSCSNSMNFHTQSLSKTFKSKLKVTLNCLVGIRFIFEFYSKAVLKNNWDQWSEWKVTRESLVNSPDTPKYFKLVFFFIFDYFLIAEFV